MGESRRPDRFCRHNEACYLRRRENGRCAYRCSCGAVGVGETLQAAYARFTARWGSVGGR